MISVDNASTDSMRCILAREGRNKVTVFLSMHAINFESSRERA